jgi:hypothetical protein
LFYTLIKTNIGQLTHNLDYQDQLVNLINTFNRVIYSITRRIMHVMNDLSSNNLYAIKQRKIYTQHFEELSSMLVVVFVDEDLAGPMNALIEEKILHKVTN